MGKVYDVTAGRWIYGPLGSYHFFAGRDASRAYVTGCFETHLTHDLRGLTLEEIQVRPSQLSDLLQCGHPLTVSSSPDDSKWQCGRHSLMSITGIDPSVLSICPTLILLHRFHLHATTTHHLRIPVQWPASKAPIPYCCTFTQASSATAIHHQ
jgi:hypothetical protein